MKKIQTRQEIEKIYIDSEKSIKSIEMKKRYLGTKHIFFQFDNNFLALLVCKMNVFFLSDFCYIANYWNSIESNFWLEVRL